MDQKIVFSQTITVHRTEYTLVKIQRGGLTAIYAHATTYLRLGPSALIQKNLDLHQSMIHAGFPVPQIVATGTYHGMDYFIEASLGQQTFATLFYNEIKNTGHISNTSFALFLSVTEQLMTAQLSTAHYHKITDSFAKSINLETLCAELPEYANQIKTLFNSCVKRLSVFPIVLTHGDFNPHNSFPGGIIDFTDSFQGFFGYDVLGAMVHNDYFPNTTDYEYFQEYSFTEDQKSIYIDQVDTFARIHHLPQPSIFIRDFEFCKAVWLLVGIHAWPKLQQYRYDLFIKRFLKDS